MRRFGWLCATLLCSVSGLILAQDPVFQLKVNVPIVTLEAVVKDSNNHPLIHLSKADFEIYEDGQLQEISYFEAGEAPRSLLVVFDVTGVMDNSATFMQRSMGAVFANVREQDKVAVGVIGPAFEMLMGFRTIDKNKPPNVRLPATRFGSNLYESLDTAARRFGKEDKRKAIIALTDGRETRMFTETQKRLAPPEIAKDGEFNGYLASAQKREVPYYFVAIDTDPRYLGPTDMEYLTLKNRTATPKGKDSTLGEDYLAAVKLRMEKLSEVTGGRVTYVKSLPEIVDAFDRITRELGYSYTMGYYPKASLDDGKMHKIEIRTRSYRVEQSRTTYGGLK